MLGSLVMWGHWLSVMTEEVVVMVGRHVCQSARDARLQIGWYALQSRNAARLWHACKRLNSPRRSGWDVAPREVEMVVVVVAWTIYPTSVSMTVEEIRVW